MKVIEFAKSIGIPAQAVFHAAATNKIPFTRDEQGLINIHPGNIREEHMVVLNQIWHDHIAAAEEAEIIEEQEAVYPDDIMEAVRQNLDLDENDSTHDDIIEQMSKDEVLDRVLEWNGICGYGDEIRQWILDIYGIDLSEMTYHGHEIKQLEVK